MIFYEESCISTAPYLSRLSYHLERNYQPLQRFTQESRCNCFFSVYYYDSQDFINIISCNKNEVSMVFETENHESLIFFNQFLIFLSKWDKFNDTENFTSTVNNKVNVTWWMLEVFLILVYKKYAV